MVKAGKGPEGGGRTHSTYVLHLRKPPLGTSIYTPNDPTLDFIHVDCHCWGGGGCLILYADSGRRSRSPCNVGPWQGWVYAQSLLTLRNLMRQPLGTVPEIF